MEQTAHACRKPVPWPDSRSWIDLVAVRKSLLNCVATSTGVVDLDTLSRIEFEHNRQVAGDVLKNIPVGTLYLAHRERGRFGLARGGSHTWTAQEAAEAIAAVSLDVHICACGQGDSSHHIPNLDHIWERSWIRAATVALGDGPGQDSWTAHTIDAVGAVLRTLVSLCDDRAHNCRVTPAERSLRGMLAWIDAMERTDVLFEHMFKRYQAERIDRTIAADLRVAPSSDEVA
ncbi:hypothetical protein pmac_cds_202 [Pandoravirus macleodensis]|uniref:Uncharacterized protein n=1 Tax=Pandoravirus macleodensis TaxID=2107707 RepID=A0A2U7UF22_9VIRU|nr:hypothetical protein pmac_cds_202 [Pandoravirus macleodensis]AVK76890.1 hypothetical protein pmac_cds_202 [Pandoravirus macleodensis]